MRLKPAVLIAVLALFSLPAMAQEVTSEAAAVFTGNVQKTATGAEVRDTATTSGGVLLNYRRRFKFLPHQGYAEINLAFTTFTQYYNPGFSQTQANVYEATGSYILPFRTGHEESHWKPFIELGAGIQMFAVVASGSVAGAHRNIRPAGVYGIGTDWRKGDGHFGFRIGYRGFLYEAPDFNEPAQVTNAITHMAEPYIGIAYQF